MFTGHLLTGYLLTGYLLTGYLLTGTAQSAALPRPAREAIRYQTLRAYQDQRYIWFNKGRLTLPGLSLLSLVKDLGIALPSVNVNAKSRLTKSAMSQIRLTDQALTTQLIAIASAFKGYHINPGQAPMLKLIDALKNHQLGGYIDGLLPQHEQVVRLRDAIAHYRHMLPRPWPRLALHFKPTLGQGHQQVITLRRHLMALGDLKKAPLSHHRQHIFDPELILALKNFQQRHGLALTGELDNNTRDALAITPEQRLHIMQMNLRRWLSLPSRPGQSYVMINIAAYQLSWIEDKQQKLNMKIIVGAKNSPTPTMTTYIDRITVNPEWTPTINIVNNDLLVKNSQTPGLLQSQNFRLAKGPWQQREFKAVDRHTQDIKASLPVYRLVQLPGNNNALGQYRFNIKNEHAVYLHDTPAKHLFDNKDRALSHGCVRLQDAGALADQFLQRESRNKLHLITARQSGMTSHLALAARIPVYITYQTAWVDAHGKLHWREDIYDLDQRQTQSDARLSNMVLASSP